MSWPGFLGPASVSQSYMADNELSVNFFLERTESPSAPGPWVLLPTPGFELRLSVGQAPIRGMFYQNGRAGFVAGFAFYEILYNSTTDTFSVILRGTVDNDGEPVTFHANGDAGNQWWITSGGTGYIFDLTTNGLSIEGNPGTTVSMGGFLSARFLYLDATTGAFYASALYDGTTWDPTMVAQSQSGDPWRALIVTPDNLIRLLGESSGECWADQGTFPFPFSEIKEAGSPFGITSPFAWTVHTTVSWLAQNQHGRGLIVRAQGYDPQRISTHAIEAAIHDDGAQSSVRAFGYQERGHAFILFTFPEADRTWAYDVSSGLWHQRDYWDVATGTSKAYRIGCAMEAFSKTLVGDRLTGDIYEMSSAFQMDVDGAAIRRVRQAPRLSNQQDRLSISRLELVMDKGQGLATGQGSLPAVMLTLSRDGGKTFGNERWSTSGAGGAFDTPCIWWRLGQGRNVVPRFVVSDPVPFPIVDLLVTYQGNAS